MTPIPAPVGITTTLPPANMTAAETRDFVRAQNERARKARADRDRAHAARLREVDAAERTARAAGGHGTINVADIYRARNTLRGGDAA